MSEDALLEEDIWEYKSIRKQKHRSSSENITTPVQKVSDGKNRPKRKRYRNKKKSIEKNDALQKAEQRSRPNEDVDQCKDDSSVQSQESVSSLTEESSQNARPIPDGYCPSCQMPFSLLLVQTPRWHVAECLDTPGSLEKECPDGLLCSSTIPSHYKRYSHFLLAASRAGNYLVNSSADTLEREVTCPTAAKPSCSPGHVEEISQNDEPSSNVKNGPNDDSTLVVHGSPQMKFLNTISESTSSFANVQKTQQIFQLTQTTDNSCKFEFYDIAASQESETGEDLGSQKDTDQPSLLQSEVDFSDPEISYSPLSAFEESEEETEEEKKVKTLQDKLLKVSKFEDEESNPVVLKTLDGHLLEQRPQCENAKMGNFLIKNKHCEDVNTVKYLDQSVKTVSQNHMSSRFCNSTCVDNQQEVLASGSCFPFNCEETEQPESLSSAAKAGNTESEDTGASALGSAYMSFTEASLLLVREDAESLLTQKSNVLKDPSNFLTDTDKMTANAIEKTAPQESLQSVVEKEENPNTAAGCFHSPISKPAPSLSLASRNAKSSSAKELKQMDIGVFFGLKPKVKEESKGETCLSEGKQMLSSETPSGKRPRQQKRKAEGSVEDVEAVTESSSKNGAFSDVSSSGQKRWRKRVRELSTAGERTTKKHCPFYKKIPGTGFSVDAFQYGEIEGCTAYFLTHFHSDHYCGLTKNFMFPIYCNKITGNLVKSKLRVKEQYVHVLPMDTECVVNGIKVVLLDANHCPGATMILFCLPSGTVILHTGDFRADPSMEHNPVLVGHRVHTLYLDTTYCSPEYTFPSQQEVIQFAVNTAFETVTLNPRTLVVCGTYSIGKEKVFLAIAEVLGSKASMSRDKYKTLQCLESAAVNSLISVDWDGTLLHVLPMMQINFKGLQDHLNKFSENFDRVLAFRPTGWTYSDSCLSLVDIKPQTRGKITIYGIPYSEHSSYLEMKRFVQWLKPQKIIPTVNVGDWRARSLMEKHFRDWMIEGSGHK
ncbi:PREDICTED: DNA cross-link repair 1A protein [Buceros rhinoceros silvestris]|uniref:DNA cross-link repair 1A protein n=1 Tax=Buceros rhinoceros silvestris TaxID=175836 RepID=UPI0005280309|nr:PREDICTED: DNA cross-link repair 1A protein [Buceros rhinoceros silvestris]